MTELKFGAHYEAQAFKSYLDSLGEDELKKVSYELFVHLQNSRALNVFLKAECNKLDFRNMRLRSVGSVVGIEELG
jgi:hypothetical protein